MSSRIRSRRAKVAAVGSVTVMAALCLTITPAQADNPGRGGSIMPDSDADLGRVDGRPFDDPARLNEFLAGCGQWCTVTPTAWLGDPREGTPAMQGKPQENCTTEVSDFNFARAETTGETAIIGLSLGANPVSVLPKIEKNWFTSNTETTSNTGHLKPGEIGWIDEIPVTRKAKGNWKLEGSSDFNINQWNQFGPREFTDVETDITYKVIRVSSRPMTPDEKKTKCGNSSPS
ncbi:hypothetical protein [Streptomyces sp. NPDC015125]|uniref:hypothetical protein n=1 Tax=Streptomyces sp. NPDC015125 TaxID=3364938 RepID=UPI0036FE93FA